MKHQERPEPIPRHDIGNIEAWRADLIHVSQLRQIVLDRQPLPQDGVDRLQDELRRALTASLFPDESATLFDAIARGAGAGGAAILTQRRWRTGDDAGIVMLAEPHQSPRSIPVGEVGISYPEWVKAFALAVIARDQDALNILCTPASIDACSLPADVIDTFWSFYCGALASVVVEQTATALWLEDAEYTLESFQIAEPNLIKFCIRPTLELVRALEANNSESFNSALYNGLKAHQQYFTSTNRQRDWNGFLALEAIALTALAFERGIPIEITSDYLPIVLVQGEFSCELSTVIYCYPERRIASVNEAHWFLDLEGFPRSNRSHRLIAFSNRLVSRYEAHGAHGMPHAIADFVLIEDQTAVSNDELSELPPALDPGELLILAEMFASITEEEGGIQALPQQRALLTDAITCIDKALMRIAVNQEAVDPRTIISVQGHALYNAEPGRFRRDRMLAYRNALDEELQKLELSRNSEADMENIQQNVQEDVQENTDKTEEESRATAMIAIEIIRAQVIPILEAIALDPTGEFTSQLAPQDNDFERVFVGEAVPVARHAYQEIWSQNLRIQHPSSPQFETRCYAAPAGMLSEENELSFHFPSGYRAISHLLNPHRVWIAWKYVAPGEQAGLSLDGLVWIEDHWAWFPKPYRALRDLTQ